MPRRQGKTPSLFTSYDICIIIYSDPPFELEISLRRSSFIGELSSSSRELNLSVSSTVFILPSNDQLNDHLSAMINATLLVVVVIGQWKAPDLRVVPLGDATPSFLFLGAPPFHAYASGKSAQSYHPHDSTRQHSKNT